MVISSVRGIRWPCDITIINCAIVASNIPATNPPWTIVPFECVNSIDGKNLHTKDVWSSSIEAPLNPKIFRNGGASSRTSLKFSRSFKSWFIVVFSEWVLSPFVWLKNWSMGQRDFAATRRVWLYSAIKLWGICERNSLSVAFTQSILAQAWLRISSAAVTLRQTLVCWCSDSNTWGLACLYTVGAERRSLIGRVLTGDQVYLGLACVLNLPVLPKKTLALHDPLSFKLHGFYCRILH